MSGWVVILPLLQHPKLRLGRRVDKGVRSIGNAASEQNCYRDAISMRNNPFHYFL